MLTELQKRLYARHVLLEELGAAGQARLCAAHAVASPLGDARASEVALDYLARGGVQRGAFVPEAPSHASDANHEFPVASSDAVSRLAGDAALLECAAWLSGAFAAVETIKQIAGVGAPGQLDPELVLTAEVT